MTQDSPLPEEKMVGGLTPAGVLVARVRADVEAMEKALDIRHNQFRAHRDIRALCDLVESAAPLAAPTSFPIDKDRLEKAIRAGRKSLHLHPRFRGLAACYRADQLDNAMKTAIESYLLGEAK